MCLPVGIDQDVDVCVCGRAVFGVILGVEDSEGQGVGLGIVVPGRGGVEGEFRVTGPVVAAVEIRCAQDRMGGAQGDQGADVVVQFLLR